MAKNTPTQEKENYCENPLKICIVGTNRERKEAVIFNPRCKQWTCPYCAELNSQYWQWVALRGAGEIAEGGSNLMFVTLTSRAYATPVKSIHYFKENWPKLVRRIKYHTEQGGGGKLYYLLIPERTKAGILHAHAIMTTNLSKKWFKDNGHACGFGYQAHTEQIEYYHGVVGYVVKYLGKDVVHTDWPKGFRRVRTSRNWPKVPDEQKPGWQYAKHSDESAWFEYYLLQDYGYKVTDRRVKQE